MTSRPMWKWGLSEMGQRFADDFADGQLNPPWMSWVTGGGQVEVAPGAARLIVPGSSGQAYTDAQITDYAGRARRDFPWRLPLRLTVRACASGGGDTLRGTAGFGLWNDPFTPTRREVPRLPRATWFFFGGPGNNMALALNQPGNGWKAATFDATRPLFFALLPLAPLGFLLMRLPVLYRAFWPLGQRALAVAEASLPGTLLAEPHDYTLEWLSNGVTFRVDDKVVLFTDCSPRGPLGFIAWIDNQYAVVTPQGRFAWGVTACEEQWLALQQVMIETL